MSNFIFSINAILPLFIIMALGLVLKKINILNDNFLKTCNSFNFKVTLPVMVFLDMASVDIRTTFNLSFFLYCAITTTVVFFGIWAGAKFFLKGKPYKGEFVQASFRSSVAVMGLALLQNIYGSSEIAGIMILGVVPLYNIYSVIVLQLESPAGKKGGKKIRDAFVQIVKNPIIIGVILGLISSLLGIKYPHIIARPIELIAVIATPLALICIGGNFNLKKSISNIRPSVIAAIIKIVVLPIVFVGIAMLLGFRDAHLVAILVMLASPTTPSCFVMAEQFGYEGTVTTSVIVLTTLFSSVTMTVFVFVMKTMGVL